MAKKRAPAPSPAAAAAGAWRIPAVLAWVLLFLALAVVPDEKLTRVKLLVLQGGVIALALAWAGRVASGSLQEATATALDWPVLAYGASGLLFYALSPEPRNSEAELARILFSCGSFFAASQMAARPRPLLRAWAGAAALAAAYAVCQKLGTVGPLVFPQLERPYSTFGNPIFLGVFLGASLAMTAALLAESAGAEAALLAAAALLQGAGLWLSQARAGFAGLLGAGLAWSLLRLSGARRARLLAGLALAALGLLAHFRGRQWTHQLIWRDALSLWRAHPWLGCGLGRFHIEFPAYASQATRALWPQDKTIVNFAHNEYLQVLAETGLVGLAAFLAVPLAFFGLLLRSARTADGLEQGPALAAAALFACALFSPDLRFGASAFLAFAALGLWAGHAARRTLALTPGRRAALAAAAAAFCAGFGWLASVPALAQRRLSREPSFAIQATPEVRASIARLEAAAAAQPDNPDLAEQTAFLYAREQALEPAARWFARAAQLDPKRPGPWNNLGNIAYLRRDFDGAIADWERSLEADPKQLDAHLNLAKLYFERGRLKDAGRHCEAALKLDPTNEKARVLLKKMVE
jgi:O-antigen ligase